MNFAKFLEMMENAENPQPVKQSVKVKPTEKHEVEPQGNDAPQGSLTDFVETENIEFHEDGHASGIETEEAKQAPTRIPRFTPHDARKGFIYSEILGKPLALRKK